VEVLHIAAQDGVPTLWAVVDPDLPRDGYTEIVAWGTGWPLPDDVYQECDYWGTCEDDYGYVWHYFAATRLSDRAYENDDAYRDKNIIHCPLNFVTTTPYSLSSVTISDDELNSKEWSFNLSQDTIDQLAKYIGDSYSSAFGSYSHAEGACSTAIGIHHR
jgi:hypothetical protein